MEKHSIRVFVYETVGSPLCVASHDGQKVYDRIEHALREGYRVAISFRNVSTLTSAFLNAAIGQLYGKFDEEHLRASLSVEDIEPDDRVLLKRVVDTAKLYFSSPERFDRAIRDAESG